MDLIEVLWKQDIDMGVSREMYDGTWKHKELSENLEEKNSNASTPSSSFNNPWQGLNYSIDSETGEHIILPVNDSSNNAAALVPNDYTDITLEEALSLFESDDFSDLTSNDMLPTEDFINIKSNDVLSPVVFPLDPDTVQRQAILQQLDELQEMVSEANSNYYQEPSQALHSVYEDISQNYNITENRDTLLNVLLQNTSLALPMNESLLNSTYPSEEDFVAEPDTSINSFLSLFTNDSDAHPVGAVGGQEQNDLCSDLPIANLTVDNTFLSQLMSEGTMDFSDFCDAPAGKKAQGNWLSRLSDDSAISSIGSDWSDSCSSETNDDTSVWTSKGTVPEKANWNVQTPSLPSPKKYQLFGKQHRPKVKSEDSAQHLPTKGKDITISSSLDEVDYSQHSSTEPPDHVPRLAFNHNHTYHHIGDTVPDKEVSQKPLERDKPKTTENRVRGTRDEKRLRKTSVPLTVKEIIDLSIEHFNERLAQLRLSDEELALVRDIRRRGKNKLAARSCRKRKVEQITDLQDVLDNLHHQREVAYSEMEHSMTRRDMLRQKYQRLYKFIFPDRDPPDPVPTSAYFGEDLVGPPSGFPVSSNGTAVNDNEHKKRGKHKNVNK